MSIIFDRYDRNISLHLYLQVAGLMLLRTSCSFRGNEEGLVAIWADFEQVIVNGVLACVKAKGEHLEHLLCLAVAYCMLLRRIVSNNLNVSVN